MFARTLEPMSMTPQDSQKLPDRKAFRQGSTYLTMLLSLQCPENSSLACGQLFLKSCSILVVRLGQKNSEIVGKRHNLILFELAQKIVRLLGPERCQQSVRVEFFGCHGSTLLACAIGTTFSATAGGKKEVVFLFEDSTV